MAISSLRQQMAIHSANQTTGASRGLLAQDLVNQARADTEKDKITPQTAKIPTPHYQENGTKPSAVSYAVGNDLYWVSQSGHIVKSSTMAYLGTTQQIEKDLKQSIRMGEDFRARQLQARADNRPNMPKVDYHGALYGQSYQVARNDVQMLNGLQIATEMMMDKPRPKLVADLAIPTMNNG